MVWQCTQRLRAEDGEVLPGELCQGDLVSALQFNKSGELLATADHAGRIVLFKEEVRNPKDEDEDMMDVSEGTHSGGGNSSVGNNGANNASSGSTGERRLSLRTNGGGSGSGKNLMVEENSGSGRVFYKKMTEFQSHEREFDYLKSMEIEERVNQVKWFQSESSSLNLLSTNDKQIKLWSIKNSKAKNITNFNFRPNMNVRPPTTSEALGLSMNKKKMLDRKGNGLSVNMIVNSQIQSGGSLKKTTYESLRVPCISNVEYVTNAVCRRSYANGHLYHIHSIDINTDGETFISADDLHINLWNLDVMHESFNIVDMQPGNMDELTEVITCAVFHPQHCNILAYSSSKGTVRLTDLRQSALCDKSLKTFEVNRTKENHSFFSEIVANVTDVKFTPNGNEFLTRDYLTVKHWDMRRESEPIFSYNVQDVLSPKLVDLYENDCIFDKFECCMSHQGDLIASGSYSNALRIFGCRDGTDELLEASTTPTRVSGAIDPAKVRSPRFALFGNKESGEKKKKELDLQLLDCSAKVRHMQFHPTRNTLAVAVAGDVYLLSN